MINVLNLSTGIQCNILDSLIQECGLYIRYGRNPDMLSTGSVEKQLFLIKSIWNNLADRDKPEWCSDHLIKEYTELL